MLSTPVAPNQLYRHLPTSHRYQPAAIQSFCRRHITGLFQGVRHHPTLQAAVLSMAELDLTMPVYNCMVDFFSGHSHRTVFSGDVSRTRSITASIQSSNIGSAAYTMSHQLISDRSTPTTYSLSSLTLTSSSLSQRAAEIDNIAAWVAENNLKLN